MPGTVLDVTSHPIAQFRPASQDVLRAAAVAGTSFSVGVVAQMLGTAVLALLDTVNECQVAGFLVAGDRPGDYRFSHALVRSAVVAQLSAADQRRLHVAAADAIECLYQGQPNRRRLRRYAIEHRPAKHTASDKDPTCALCPPRPAGGQRLHHCNVVYLADL